MSDYALSNTTSSGGSGSPTIVGAEYLASPPTLSNGQTTPLLTDNVGDLNVNLNTLINGEDPTNKVLGTIPKVIPGTTYSRLAVACTGVGQVLKNSAGQFMGFMVQNEGATAFWAQIWDGTLGSGTLLWQEKCPGGSANAPGACSIGSDILGQNGLPANTSINMGHSSTATTYTALGSFSGITSTGVVSR